MNDKKKKKDIHERVSFHGYLMKMVSQKWMRDTREKFRKRWVSMVGTKIYFFRSRNDEKPVGVIQLGKDVVVEENLCVENSFLIKGFKDPRGRTYYFEEIDGESEHDSEEWIKKIGKAIRRAKRKNLQSSILEDEFDKYNFRVVYTHPKYVSIDKNIVSLEDDFELVELMGRSPTGKLLKVVSKESGNTYAMKLMKKEMVIRERFIERTTYVERDLKNLFVHPFIMTMAFVFQNNINIYYFMEYYTGGELFEKIYPSTDHSRKNTRPFTIDQSRFYISELILGVGYLHSQNIIIRDLKPSMLVLDKHGDLIITGTGYFHHAFFRQWSTHKTFCGSPEYISPEIVKGEGHGRETDWWSVGTILYEMLTGVSPFYREDIQELYESIIDDEEIEFPSEKKYASEEYSYAISLVKSLLVKVPGRRLGFVGGAEEIKKHSFFNKNKDYRIDYWKMLEKKKIRPPFFLTMSWENEEMSKKDIDERIRFIVRDGESLDIRFFTVKVVSCDQSSSTLKEFSFLKCFFV